MIIDLLLNLGGTLATEASSLREALDAALSSPSGRGVIVGDDGTVAGTVTASEVLGSDRAGTFGQPGVAMTGLAGRAVRTSSYSWPPPAGRRP